VAQAAAAQGRAPLVIFLVDCTVDGLKPHCRAPRGGDRLLTRPTEKSETKSPLIPFRGESGRGAAPPTRFDHRRPSPLEQMPLVAAAHPWPTASPRQPGRRMPLPGVNGPWCRWRSRWPRHVPSRDPWAGRPWKARSQWTSRRGVRVAAAYRALDQALGDRHRAASSSGSGMARTWLKQPAASTCSCQKPATGRSPPSPSTSQWHLNRRG